MNFVHKFNNLKSSYHFLKKFLARSIAFHPPPRNESIQCAVPTPFIFCFFEGSLFLTDSFQNSLKTCINAQNCIYNVQKLFARGGWQKKGGDVRMGEERHGCWGIDAPGLGVV